MKGVLAILRELFSIAVRAYPRAYRDEFGDEMMSVFSETLEAAAFKGFGTLMSVIAREFCTLPFNLFKIHFERKDKMLRKFSVQSTSLIVRSTILFGLDPLLQSLLDYLKPSLGSLSLAISTFLSNLGLTDAFPTTETYLPELQLGLYGLGSLIMAFALIALLRHKIAAKRVLLAWGVCMFLPELLYRAFLSNYGLRDFQAINDSQVYFLLGQVRMFQSMLTGASLGYLFGHLADESYQRSSFVFAGMLGYPLIGFIERSFFPAPRMLTDSLEWPAFAGNLVHGLLFGIVLGILFSLAWFASREKSSLKLA